MYEVNEELGPIKITSCSTTTMFVQYQAETFTWTAPPPAWTPTDSNDIRTVKYPVLNGSTNVALRWNYTLGTGELVASTAWQLDGTQIALEAAITIISDDRFDVKKSEVATLIIKNVNELEDATVQCAVQTSLSNWKYKIRLEITGEIQIELILRDLRNMFQMWVERGANLFEIFPK